MLAVFFSQVSRKVLTFFKWLIFAKGFWLSRVVLTGCPSRSKDPFKLEYFIEPPADGGCSMSNFKRRMECNFQGWPAKKHIKFPGILFGNLGFPRSVTHFHGTLEARGFVFSIFSKANLETLVDYLQWYFYENVLLVLCFFLVQALRLK